MTAPTVVPRELADEVSQLADARVVHWFRSEDYGTHERLVGYVVELASEEHRDALMRALHGKGMSAEPKSAVTLVVYMSE